MTAERKYVYQAEPSLLHFLSYVRLVLETAFVEVHDFIRGTESTRLDDPTCSDIERSEGGEPGLST